MNLPYPFTYRGRTIMSVDVRSPTGGTLADASRAADGGDVYKAFLVYLAGSVASLEAVDGGAIEGTDIKDALRDVPYYLAEWIAFQSLLKAGAQDEIDIAFRCPRCGARFERDETALMSELVLPPSDIPPTVKVPLSVPVTFQSSTDGHVEVIESVEAMTFRLPTLGDCIKCGNMGIKDNTRLQYAIWAEALVEVNGQEIDQKWRGTFGVQSFDRMKLMDLRNVSQALGKWAIDNTVSAHCPQCGKQYKQEVPTGNFFVSALRVE